LNRHTLRVTLKEPFAPLNHLAASTYLAGMLLLLFVKEEPKRAAAK